MEPDCPLCCEKKSDCRCDPSVVRVAELSAEVQMLTGALSGWRSEHTSAVARAEAAEAALERERAAREEAEERADHNDGRCAAWFDEAVKRKARAEAAEAALAELQEIWAENKPACDYKAALERERAARDEDVEAMRGFLHQMLIASRCDLGVDDPLPLKKVATHLAAFYASEVSARLAAHKEDRDA